MVIRDEFAVGVDIGGTFTDVVLAGSDGIRSVAKQLTTPRDPAEAAVEAIRDAVAAGEVEPGAVTRVVHGTTLATNTILQHAGERVALVTTRGFRHMIGLGRHARVEEERYDLEFEPPEPPVPIPLVFEVAVDQQGLPDPDLVVVPQGALADDALAVDERAVARIEVFHEPALADALKQCMDRGDCGVVLDHDAVVVGPADDELWPPTPGPTRQRCWRGG
jgi:N-methylhydantoinase A